MSVIKGLVSPEFIGNLFGLVFSFWSLLLICRYKLVLEAFIYRRVIGFNRKLIGAKSLRDLPSSESTVRNDRHITFGVRFSAKRGS